MSFKEQRSFCEIMRSLGFNRIISIQNFKLPNFNLLAEILYWFIQRFDHNAEIPINIQEDKDRVENSESYIYTLTIYGNDITIDGEDIKIEKKVTKEPTTPVPYTYDDETFNSWWSFVNDYFNVKEENRLKKVIKDALGSPKVKIEKEILGSFVDTFEKVVNSKGPNNGRTIKTELTSKVTSDGEVILLLPMRILRMCSNSGPSNGSMNDFKSVAFMTIGSPPVKRTSVSCLLLLI